MRGPPTTTPRAGNAALRRRKNNATASSSPSTRRAIARQATQVFPPGASFAVTSAAPGASQALIRASAAVESDRRGRLGARIYGRSRRASCSRAVPPSGWTLGPSSLASILAGGGTGPDLCRPRRIVSPIEPTTSGKLPRRSSRQCSTGSRTFARGSAYESHRPPTPRAAFAPSRRSTPATLRGGSRPAAIGMSDIGAKPACSGHRNAPT
jgi:hypothetical protein